MDFKKPWFFYVILVYSEVMILVQAKCMSPPPSSNFTLGGYYGLWFEAGKIQTPGGAFFEKDCVCTTIEVEPKSNKTTGDCTALNSCRKLKPQGKYINATGQLEDMNPPGKWKESFFFFLPKVDYTVIYLDKDFAVEYDCGETLGITNYCIHVMARVPDPDLTKVQSLVNFAEQLGLNTDKLPYNQTHQAGCWGKR
ncbi:prostaglandin-h2 d-isomerase [Plakobranchus ocellatus]|uniref:Prostaglandin-h2 d-isomerase n=1 Tax=Plakobranchus ocellatus TaxID=259542 RepID=A0AAV3YJI9_9GAST|nr:prostaglandin-h2 d-isomerase [Plakobranchus ocellatus]